MSALAARTGAINLGQGFPDTDGPPEVARGRRRGDARRPQPVPARPGIPELREAIAAHQRRFYGLELDPDGEVLVTTGATEAIAAALLALCEPGDEVVAFEPYYDSYAACIAMAGATRRVVTLRAARLRARSRPLAAAFTARTRLLLLNSPHNPTGKVFDRADLEHVARLCDRARRPRGHRRGLRAPRLRRPRARPARDAARHARPHADDLLRRQDLLLHRLEDRLGDRPAGARRGRPDRQAVPHLRQRRALPARDRPRARAAATSTSRASPPTSAPSATACARASRRPASPCSARRAPTSSPPTSARSASPTACTFCLQLPERAGVVAVPTVVFYDDRRPGGRSSASRSASATR